MQPINKKFLIIDNLFPKLKSRLRLVILPLALIIIVFALYSIVKNPGWKVKGIEQAALSLSPSGVNRNLDGKWSFTPQQNLNVNLVLDTGADKVESAEAIIHYDPSVLSLNSLDCNSLSAFKTTLFNKIYYTDETNTTQSGTAWLACTTIPIPYNGTYSPADAQSTFNIGSFNFTVLKIASSSNVTFEFTPGSTNDSNVVKYQEAVDVLGSINDLNFSVSAPKNSATLTLSPATGTYLPNTQFAAQIVLSTGEYSIDSTDVIIDYDPTKLQVENLTAGSIFSQSLISNIDNNIGRIQLSSNVAASLDAVPVFGENLLLGTINFNTLASANNTPVSFLFNGVGDRNDSNVVEFKQGNDVLGQVVNANYTINIPPTLTSTPAPTMTPTPTVTPTPTSTPTNTPSPTPTPTPTSTPTATPTPTFTPTLTPTPTAPNTPTPTTTPIPLTLSMKLFLEGRNWAGAPQTRNVQISVKGTNIVINSATDSTGSLKNLTLNSLTPGDYSLLIKPEGFLQKQFTVTLSAGYNSIDFSAMPIQAGDLDGSNAVNSLDYNILLLNFKTNNVLCDLDGSGQVNSLDFSLTFGNWNKTGDE